MSNIELDIVAQDMPQDPNHPVNGDGPDAPFWERKSLAEMTSEEWESLCDGCGRCCLIKLEDIDTGDLVFTDVACHLLDREACRCTSYATRSEIVTDCVKFTADSIRTLEWMPPTCAYRLLAAGQGLYWWHPLVSGDPESVQKAGISVRGKVCSEVDVGEDELEDHVVDWPYCDPTKYT